MTEYIISKYSYICMQNFYVYDTLFFLIYGIFRKGVPIQVTQLFSSSWRAKENAAEILDENQCESSRD